MKKRILIVALLLVCSFFLHADDKQHVAVIGTGYVGLVLGACLADLGHTVYCADIDAAKIAQLQRGEMPIFEPELPELVQKNTEAARLFFTDDIGRAIQQSDVVFIAVGTPAGPNGSADISAVEAVANTIGMNLNGNKTVCIKSTLPIGMSARIMSIIQEHESAFDVRVISNPEFLREGFAVHDFFNPDRIIIGAESEDDAHVLHSLYAPLLVKNIPVLHTDLASAETIKYASNAFLAVKVAYINEIAQLCDKSGANITDVAKGMGLDKRIGNKFLVPGPGFGGSCFPKDALALMKKGEELGSPLRIITASVEANYHQKMYVVRKVCDFCGNDLKNKTIAIWGLAFKANTDDVRSAPAIYIITSLLSMGAHVKAYDPIAMSNMKKVLPSIEYCQTKEQAIEQADALVILTEWQEFKAFDYATVSEYMVDPIIIDMRDVVRLTQATRKKPIVCYKLGQPGA